VTPDATPRPDAVPNILYGRWMHSHEEDTADEMVYRPASFSFPRSRGRAGFELRPDQSLVEVGIGPSDKVEERPGTWDFDGGKLVLNVTSADRPAQLDVISVDKDRLLIKKGVM
jgi:hypothetical protein